MKMRTAALLALPFLAFALAGTARAQPPAGCTAPNEADPDLIRTIVRTSVPPLTCPSLRTKLSIPADAEADFQFFRTVVPWYWDFLRRDAACAANKNQGVLRTELHALANDFPGLCAGDPHPENFALQFNPPPAAPTFGVNDPDDAGQSCPVVADLFRFVVGTKLARPDANTKALVDRYVAAVTAPSTGAPRSSAISALAAKGPKDEETDLPASGTPCSKAMLAGLTKAYRESLTVSGLSLEADPTAANCVDVSGQKESGGSGGLPRFAMRVMLKNGSAPSFPRIVQFKGTQANATAFFRDPPKPWDARDRYSAACLAERGKDAVPCPVVTPIPGGGSFFVRTKNERTVKFEKLKPDAVQSVYEDEAGALGALHGRSLDSAKAAEYAKRLRALRDALDVDATAFVETVKKSAAALRSVLAAPGAFEAACEPPISPSPVPPRPVPPPRPKKRDQSGSAN
ncbi:MAG: hypothetical protein JST04_13780 [Bdellovibrionales bacterium]|nr:hypothetical protein [Bdellovibrionales bacterium]